MTMMMIEFVEQFEKNVRTMSIIDSSRFQMFIEYFLSPLFQSVRQINSKLFEHFQLNSSAYLWYLTIIVTFLTIVLILTIFCEPKSDPKLSQYLFFQSASSFFLHAIFNQKGFCQQFRIILDQWLNRKEVEQLSFLCLSF